MFIFDNNGQYRPYSYNGWKRKESGELHIAFSDGEFLFYQTRHVRRHHPWLILVRSIVSALGNSWSVMDGQGKINH